MRVVCTGRTSEAPEMMQRQAMLRNFVMEKSEVTIQSMALLMSSVCWLLCVIGTVLDVVLKPLPQHHTTATSILT